MYVFALRVWLRSHICSFRIRIRIRNAQPCQYKVKSGMKYYVHEERNGKKNEPHEIKIIEYIDELHRHMNVCIVQAPIRPVFAMYALLLSLMQSLLLLLLFKRSIYILPYRNQTMYIILCYESFVCSLVLQWISYRSLAHSLDPLCPLFSFVPFEVYLLCNGYLKFK